jgi:tetratricopeptide (TPR) repeat protein
MRGISSQRASFIAGFRLASAARAFLMEAVTSRRFGSRSPVVLALAFVFATALAFCPDVRVALADDADPAAVAAAAADEDVEARARARARARAALDIDEEGDAAAYDAGMGMGMGSMFTGRSGLLGTGLMAFAFYFMFVRGRGRSQAMGNWGSYYLFWIVAPAVIAVATSHPAALIVVLVGLIARRWLPDPFLALRHSARARKLSVEVGANAGNVTARRDLAMIWLEKRRPQHALPLLDQALARDPESPELLFLRGDTLLALKQPERALESFVAVVQTNRTFRYGEAYLRAADALIALGRHDDAEEALGHYLKINSSSIEALVKLARVHKAKGDAAGVARARAEARDVWHVLHGFQRRKQFGWYVRSRFGP